MSSFQRKLARRNLTPATELVPYDVEKQRPAKNKRKSARRRRSGK